MDTDVLDHRNTADHSENNGLLLVSIGIFTLVMMQGVSYSLQMLTRDLFMNLAIDVKILEWSLEIVSFLTYVLSGFLVASSIKNRLKQGAAALKGALWALIAIFLAAQAFQYFYVGYLMELMMSNPAYIEQLQRYLDASKSIYLPVIFQVLRYLALGVIFLKKQPA